MDERAMQFRVGVMVLATLLITLILLVWLGKVPLRIAVWEGSAQTIHILFEQAPGVSKGIPVRKSGIRVGRVSNVQFATLTVEQGAHERSYTLAELRKLAVQCLLTLRTRDLAEMEPEGWPKRFNKHGRMFVLDVEREEPAARSLAQVPCVLVSVQLEPRQVVYSDEECQLRINPISGDAALEIVRETLAADAPSSRQLPPGDEGTAGSPLRAAAAAPVAAGGIIKGVYRPGAAQLMDELPQTLAGSMESLRGTLDAMPAFFAELQGSMRAMKEFFTKHEQNLDVAIKSLGNTLTQVGNLAQKVNTLIGDERDVREMREAMRKVPGIIDNAQATIAGMRDFSTRLSEPQFFSRLDRSVRSLEAAFAQIAQFTEAMNNSRGTLGMLLNDPELYQHLCRAARNIDELTRQLRPILNDARVFSDKVSRHPGVIVRDAVRPGVGIK
jgi:phospholipid/cholesterol/gamma-HCH transport system substrate-binding protein